MNTKASGQFFLFFLNTKWSIFSIEVSFKVWILEASAVVGQSLVLAAAIIGPFSIIVAVPRSPYFFTL